jgi:hypothetical protein
MGVIDILGVGKRMNRLPKELVKAGQNFMSNLMDANIRNCLAGLGGCKEYNKEDFPEDQLPYIEAYNNQEICSVEACYLYMRSLEDAQKN